MLLILLLPLSLVALLVFSAVPYAVSYISASKTGDRTTKK